jgi:hypothetical protein
MSSERVDRILAILDAGQQWTTPEHHGCALPPFAPGPTEQYIAEWVSEGTGSFTFGPSTYTGLTVRVDYTEVGSCGE